MKKILFILLLFLSLAINSEAQYSSKRYGYEHDQKLGLCITGAGAVFTIAGFLTVPDYTWVQTSPNTGHWKQKPFMQQGARSACIVTGITLTCSGLITMLTGN
jgi:hypothetical protein